MDLQPLYEVKARLEQAAIAGTGLLAEDFRLSRAAEGLKPLAAASPVFAKLDAGLNALLAAPAQARAPLLLDVLALADAVVYTQAQTGGGGEWTPLPTGSGLLHQLSYGQAKPLLDALTGSGGGRMEAVRDAWETHPEFFSDFRILPAVVAGLGDSYSELAELNAEILKKLGPAPLPLLKKGFDPAGKKEMARRVEVIAALEGPAATPWLRELLPVVKKDVRLAVLTALACDPENTPLLLELAKAERGKNREAVLTALAKQDSGPVRDFWDAEIKRNPVQVEFLQDNGAAWVSDLAAAAFRAILEAPVENDLSALNRCRPAVLGRSSPAMLDCWRWIDSQLPALSKLKRGPNTARAELSLPSWLLDSLCRAGPSPLCGLSRELWETHREEHLLYLPSAMIAALLTRPAAEAFEAFAPWFQPPKGQTASAERHARQTMLLETMEKLRRDKENRIVIGSGWLPAQPLDPRWFELLFLFPDAEHTLLRLVSRDDPELHDKLNAYLFRKLVNGRLLREDVARLRRRGWTQWKGFLDKSVRRDGSLTVFAVSRLLNETSLSGPEKASELRSLEKIVQAQSAASKRPAWPEQSVQRQAGIWELE